MKTQISRHSFAPEQRYSGVYQQMGRMITDADWNELNDLVQHRLVEALTDVIGDGSPRARGLVRQTGADSYELRWGHVYVDGIPGRVVPDDPTLGPVFVFEHQADLPGVPALTAGSHRLYLDVWERTVTPLEDPTLMDPGLHGADTCTRSQTMAQVKACPATVDPTAVALNPPIGTIPLSLWIRQGATLHDPCDPCAEELSLPEDVGNFLFRVEVHDVLWSDEPIPEIIGLTLKWSRENGAEAYQVGQFPPGFDSGHWSYEYFSGPSDTADEHMLSEKHLGRHLLPGFSPQRGVLSHGYSPESAPAMSLVRRWDGFARFDFDGAAWTLSEGYDRNIELSTGLGDSDHGFVDIGGASIELNLDQLLLQFSLADELALAGDYWLATVRQAIHSAGDPLIEAETPQGILHHYWLIGSVDVDADGVITRFTPDLDNACKAFEFPPLTDIDAGDVCYRNEACEMPGVRTVEDALDHLCRERDLRWHNKHLHGWGVVCGLVAECGGEVLPDTNGTLHHRRVRVSKGYALSCEGDDIVLEQQQFFDVIAALEQLDNNPLDDGSGEVCLYIELNDSGAPVLRISAEEAPNDDAYGWLKGTLWLDFYNDCLKGLIDEIRAEIEDLGDDSIAAAENDEQLVSPQRMRVTSLLNLLAQLFYRPHGEQVFLSLREHALLHAFYLRLREILASTTFCGQSRGQDFPAYPFPDTGLNTWFGKNHHDKLAHQPAGDLLLSYGGAGTELNLYSIAEGTLVAVDTVPSAEGAEISAATFSNDSQLLFVAADINGTDSILSRARLEGLKLVWEQSAILCGLRISDLRFDPSQSQTLYATGIGSGLFVLNTGQLFGDEKQIPTPAYRFNASGHVDAANGLYYATAQSQEAETNDGRYDRVVRIDLAKARGITGAPQTPDFELLLQQNGQSVQGSDGLAVGEVQADDTGANRQAALFVAIDGSASKSVWEYGGALSPTSPPQRQLSGLANTGLRLRYHAQEQGLLLSLEDEFRLQLWQNGKPVVDRVPVQLFPCDFCIDAKSGDVLVLNFASNTISAVPRAELHIDDGFLDQLRSYRLQVLLAFIALFGNLLQNLKDCFCNLLLTRCPECDDDEKVWLAKVEIRDNEVYKICNFAKRRHVKTFPKVEYWLSLIPVLPAIRKAVQSFCCSLIPNKFQPLVERYMMPVQSTQTPIKGAQYRQSVKTVQRTDMRQLLRTPMQNLRLSGQLAVDGLMTTSRALEPGGAVSKQAYRNLATEEAVTQLEAQQIKTEVKPYDPQRSGDYIRAYTTTPNLIPRGSKVTVYEEQGQVKFYTLETATTTAIAVDDSQLDAFAARKEALADLSALNSSLAEAGARKAAVEEVGALQNQLDTLDQRKVETQQEIGGLQLQLAELKSERSSLETEIGSLQEGLKTTTQELDKLKVEIDGQRPISAAGVDTDTRKVLLEAGIMTLSDLAVADSTTLTSGTRLTRTQANKLIRDTQTRLKLR
ncbi:DUF6519 domain-containing protein [Marinobacterium rhizophilum]|uniref:Uncharacterized protein n=1 Tax=Marinobacterium rhizophilum TaxID=420402 RepID=A0ABY5HJ64_9GAMM|nr:DUF6519 domain-containing protein [Marinobacterium rhizophilum]UTW11329.1 hypothetical protein KDW95_19000 [Marinobacterium rhizophilum]